MLYENAKCMARQGQGRGKVVKDQLMTSVESTHGLKPLDILAAAGQPRNFINAQCVPDIRA